MFDVNEILGKAGSDIVVKIITNAAISAKSWILDMFKHHREKIQENADKNILSYLKSLGDILKKNVELLTEFNERIEQTLNSPDFAYLLEKSFTIAAKTDDPLKHDILADLITDRLLNEAESIEALLYKGAIEKIEYMNSTHLKLLGYITLFEVFEHHVKKAENPRLVNNFNYFDEDTVSLFENFDLLPGILAKEFIFYNNCTVENIDLQYLGYLNCIEKKPIERPIGHHIFPVFRGGPTLSEQDLRKSFFSSNIGQKVGFDWIENHLQSWFLSPIGRQIGLSVFYILRRNDEPH